MKQFEIGHSYYFNSACDHDTVSTVTIVGRTDKTVVFEQDGHRRRAKLHTDADGEYIMPERYSMAPVYHAIREVFDSAAGDLASVEEYAAAKWLVPVCQAQCVAGMLGTQNTMRTNQLEFLLMLLKNANDII